MWRAGEEPPYMPLFEPQDDEDDVLVVDDPEGVAADSPGPELLSFFSDSIHGATPSSEAVASEEAQIADDTPAPLPEFDSRVREPFEGLLFLGALTKEFPLLGHTIKIRTLQIDETLEIGLLHREYVGTIADIRAYATMVVAACLVSVDGRPMPSPLGDDVGDTPLSNRYAYVRDHYYPVTVDRIYEEYLVLESEVGRVLDAMGEASGQMQPISG
jgi:hypothetical protein